MVGFEGNETHNNREAFAVGAEVEVSSDEEGFRGAWFRVTIVESPTGSASKKKKKALVEYQNLVTEDGKAQLREYVDIAYLRPLPPDVGMHDLEVGDIVDADYRDGWWTGVIKKVLVSPKCGINTKYRVFFENPPDVIEFERRQIRKHQDWLGGKWIPAKKKEQMTGSTFSPGTDVEVNIYDIKDLCNAWVPALVVKENEDNTFLVKYGNSEAKKFKNNVDCRHIRLPPPCYSDRSYELHDKVEVYYDFAWQAGVITKVQGGKKYTVNIKRGTKSKEFSHSEIRPQVEWNDGKWNIVSKELLVTCNSSLHEELEHASKSGNETGEASQEKSSGAADNKLEKRTPHPAKSMRKLLKRTTDRKESISFVLTSSKKVVESPAPNGNASHLHPSENLQDENATELTTEQLKKEIRGGSASPATGERRSIRSRKPVTPFNIDCPAKDKKARSKRQKDGGVDIQNTNSLKTMGRPPKFLAKSMLTVAEGSGSGLVKEGNASSDTTEKNVAKEGISMKNVAKGVTAEKNVAKGGTAEKNVTKEGTAEKNVAKEGTAEKNVAKGGTAEKYVAKEGTAEKNVAKEGMKKEAAVPVVIGLSAEGVVSSESENPSHALNEELLMLMKDQKKSSNNPAETKNMEFKQQQASGGSSNKRKRGRPRKLVVLNPEASEGVKHLNGAGHAAGETVLKDSRSDEVALVTQGGVEITDSQEASKKRKADVSVTKCTSNEAAIISLRPSSNIDDDDRPLSMWIGGTELKLSHVKAVDPLQEGREPALITDGNPPGHASNKSLLERNVKLPFEKISPLWTVIESMEVFRKLPQNPHFTLLYKSKEEHREGIAIGNMVTFTRLTEKISKLSFDDEKNVFKSTLESLVDLEKHGFSVSVLKDRVTELLSIKDRKEAFCNESKDAESKILEYDSEKSKLEKEMDEIMVKIKELQEKHATMKSAIETKDLEMARLRQHVDAIDESVHSARLDFNKIVAAPFESV
ncbi:hypothetical protein UlMin_030795 [Ulmus minor]